MSIGVVAVGDSWPDETDGIAEAWVLERPQTPVGSIGIVTRIWTVAKLLGDDRTRLLRKHDTDVATLDLLSTLRRAGAPYRLTTRELADRSLLTPSAITQRVDRASRAGLVKRTPRGDNSRRVDIELTPQGHETVELLVDAVLGREEHLMAGLDAREREDLASLLRKLLGQLRCQLNTDGRPRQVGE